ncbi:MAG: MBL fold metallo-hydrolase [Myxococcota bacterium]
MPRQHLLLPAHLLTLLLAACASQSPAQREPTPEPAAPSTVEAEATPPPAPRVSSGAFAWNPERTLTVHVLDVGQGSATLLETPCGAVLVDTGGERNGDFDGEQALLTQLDAFFARRSDLNHTLALLVLTHPHLDHVRGVPAVLQRYVVRNVVHNGQPGGEVVREQMDVLRSRLQRGDIGERAVRSDEIPAGGLSDAVVDPLACATVDPRIRVLSGSVAGDPGWGEEESGTPHFSDENNHSVVLRVDFGAASLLITGDLETPAIEDLVRRYEGTGALDVDLLVVGHHGSANGTTPSLLQATTPRVAVISCGPPDRRHAFTAHAHGHPRRRVVELLQDAILTSRNPVDAQVASGPRRFSSVQVDRAVYATAWDGTVVVRLNADGPVAVMSSAR